MTKIEIGAGETPRKNGYKICDIRNLPNVDFCCNAIDLDQYVESNSVTDIYARHFIEHLTFDETNKLMNVFNKILISGGRVEIIVPNIVFHINQWINSRHNKQSFRHAKAGFWGWQRIHNDKSYWDVHKSGYDKESIKEIITQKGFVEFFSHKPETDPHLHVTFKKK